MPFPTVGCIWFSSDKSPFFHTIMRIVFGGPQKQMVRVDAFWVVASVTDHKAVRDKPLHENPCHPVSHSHSALETELPVSKGILGGLPVPAFIIAALIDLRHKSIDNFSHGWAP
jgi:hypothetical protein